MKGEKEKGKELHLEEQCGGFAAANLTCIQCIAKIKEHGFEDFAPLIKM